MLYILLPVHNRRDVTERLIKCFKVQTFQDFTIVLIDDGSIDNTSQMVLEYFPDTVIIQGKGDWWWGGSLHMGYRWLKDSNVSNDDLVLIMNDDTIIEPDFLAKGVDFIKKAPKTLLLAQCDSLQTGRSLDRGVHINWATLTFRQAVSPEEINCLSTRGLFCRAEDFLSLGGFYPRLLPHYFSDYEFTVRAKRMGFALVCESHLHLKVDEETTGFHKIGSKPFKKFLIRHFSIKNPLGPLYFIAFVLLAAPWQWKVVNALRVCMRSLAIIAIAFLQNLGSVMSFRNMRTVLKKSVWIESVFKRYRSYFRRLRLIKKIHQSDSLKIVFGASGIFSKEWIPTDIDNLDLLKREDWKRYFQPSSVDAMLAEHVWEHLTMEEALLASQHCYEYLKPGGYLRLAVPDGCHPDPEYIDYVKVDGSGPGSDDHKVLYTYKTMQTMLEKAGFTVNLLEYFDEEGQFHAVDWRVEDGKIHRSARFDPRNQDGSRSYTSLIADACKK